MVKSKEPRRNVYVGHRYVPLIMGEWDKSIAYEGLSIVQHEGNSYTSRKHVPIGIDILNEEFWTITGNYNAQIENYRKDVKDLENKTKEQFKNIIYDVEFYGADIDLDNTESLNTALKQAEKDNRKMNINKQYESSGNIDHFLGGLRENKLLFDGDGSIKRGDNVFYITPKGDEMNTLYISSNGNIKNDGLTKETPVNFTTAIKFLSSLKSKTLDGHWRFLFTGTHNEKGFINEKLPYFKNPLIFEGEMNEQGEYTHVIDGENVNSAYFFRADTGSGFAKLFTFKNLNFTNWDLNESSSGAIVVWDNIDVVVDGCKATNCSHLVWGRNGRLRVYDSIVDTGNTGIRAQYNTSFNIERNQFINVSSRAVSIGRMSGGHVRECEFTDCYINIEASQSSRLRTIENIHNNWGYTGVNIFLNATWEGIENEIVNYTFGKDKPFYMTFYGSSLPQVNAYTPVSRHFYKYLQNFYLINETGSYNLNDAFGSPLRLNEIVFRRENIQTKITITVHSDAHPDSSNDPGYDFNIKLSKTSEESSFLNIPIVTEHELKGDIDINIYSRDVSGTFYYIVTYPDGDFVKTKYGTFQAGQQFTKNDLMICRLFLNTKTDRELRVLGIQTHITH